MNTRTPLLFITILFVSCKTSISCDEYFTTVSVNEIKELPTENILYETHYIDSHFTDLGTYDVPQIPFALRYDTVARYFVAAFGYIILNDMGQTSYPQIVDSVKISKIAVSRKEHKLEFYSNKHPENSIEYNYKPWNECPIPKSVRNKIREDFLTRMKYRKYHLKINERFIPVAWGYKLYE